ncbi:hypothetical protein HDE79_000883 [Rhodanobacter sp. MP1X3]|nr:hypothetical protein [Rhodanobacter sp. MP1X3]
MSATGAVNSDFNNAATSETVNSPTGMHRPGHSELDTEETACLDEVLHEAALRDSMLRPPR